MAEKRYTLEEYTNAHTFKYFIGGLVGDCAFAEKADCQRTVDALNLAEDYKKLYRKIDRLHGETSEFLGKWVNS